MSCFRNPELDANGSPDGNFPRRCGAARPPVSSSSSSSPRLAVCAAPPGPGEAPLRSAPPRARGSAVGARPGQSEEARPPPGRWGASHVRERAVPPRPAPDREPRRVWPGSSAGLPSPTALFHLFPRTLPARPLRGSEHTWAKRSPWVWPRARSCSLGTHLWQPDVAARRPSPVPAPPGSRFQPRRAPGQRGPSTPGAR